MDFWRSEASEFLVATPELGFLTGFANFGGQVPCLRINLAVSHLTTPLAGQKMLNRNSSSRTLTWRTVQFQMGTAALTEKSAPHLVNADHPARYTPFTAIQAASDTQLPETRDWFLGRTSTGPCWEDTTWPGHPAPNTRPVELELESSTKGLGWPKPAGVPSRHKYPRLIPETGPPTKDPLASDPPERWRISPRQIFPSKIRFLSSRIGDLIW